MPDICIQWSTPKIGRAKLDQQPDQQTLNVAIVPYRADIDGLRALAVAGVVLFHAFPTILPAGYVGVDVFFVISGFLITHVLQADLLDQRHGLLVFYERRVERLFPALITVCLAVAIAGWLLLFPPELENLGKHLLACLTFSSNFFLWNEAGYFDADAQLKPLRMLWSLAIEEQFYLVWPISLWYIARRKDRWLAIPILALLLSFIVCLSHSTDDAPAAYYSPLSRAWEPLLGCLLALAQKRNLQRFLPQILQINSALGWDRSNLTSAAGMLGLLASFCVIPGTAQYPGSWALLPTIGTLLLIAAGPRPLANRLLARRPCVWLGRVSYPVYLWHWPILAFMRIVYGDQPSAWSRACAVFGSILIALITYRLLERPVSQHRSSKIALLLVGLFVLASGATGYVFVETAGLPKRPTLSNALPGLIGDQALNQYFSAVYSEFGACSAGPLRDDAPRFHAYIRCFESKPGQPVDLALVGDSHAENLFLGLAEALPKKNIALYMHGSIPLSSNRAFDQIYRMIKVSKDIKVVIIASYWSPRNSRNTYSGSLESALSDTVTPLLRSNKMVYLTGDTPNFPYDASHCKYRRLVQWGPDSCDEDANFFAAQQQEYLAVFHRMTEQSQMLKILQLTDPFCDEKVCRMQIDGTIVFRDRDHLNVEGSRALGLKIVQLNPELAEK